MGNSDQSQIETPTQGVFAVVAHVFYKDVWLTIADRLKLSPFAFDLYATVPDAPNFDEVAAAVAADFPAARILRTPNRGRDIAPFLLALEQFNLYRYGAVLKVHTKRSNHLGEHGARWAHDLIMSLMGDAETIAATVQVFTKFPKIGMIYPDFVKESILTELLSNMAWVDALQSRLRHGPKPPAAKWDFAAGTMFWFRGSAMLPLRELAIRLDEFEPEQGQINGTLAHGLERIFPQVIYRSGHLVMTADRITTVPEVKIAHAVAGSSQPAPVMRKGFRTPPRRTAKRV